MTSLLRKWFEPLLVAVFGAGIPFSYRWRLLFLQPLTSLILCMKVLPWTFSNAYSVFYIPTRGGRSVRCTLFKPPSRSRWPKPLRPLHVDIHGGAFFGGLPELDTVFAQQVALRTGAVVVCPSYRLAPEHTFPAAHDDIEDVIHWLHKHAEDKLGADSELMTLSGFSAGGTLAVAASQIPECQPPKPTAIKATVTFYAPLDLRMPPAQKPRPPNYPKTDPLRWLVVPLADAYVAPIRADNMDNPRLNPILSPLETLPKRLLLIIPTLDILLNEQRTFVQQVKHEIEEKGLEHERTIQSLEFEGQIHGWVELPSAVIDENTRIEAFDTSIKFLYQTYLAHGWDWEDH